MMMKKDNLIKCGVWMVAAFVCLLVVALTAAGQSVYTAASIAGLACMAISAFYWVRFAMPLTRNAFKFK